jgi:ribonuclease BN (tRNA processing enzyme)
VGRAAVRAPLVREAARLTGDTRRILPTVTSPRITFLGSGDAFAGGGRFQPCLHLDGGAEPLLLDCGATTLVALKRAAIDPASIGWVALSHLHGDHFAGLPWLILDGQFAKRTRPLVIAGPEGVRERVERTFEALYPGATEAERPFETRFLELATRTPCQLGPAVVTPHPVQHSSGAPSYALRVEYAGKVIAYSGDTEWTDTLVDAAAGADLFVCECNFFDRQAPGHLDYRTLAAKRSKLNCRRIVLTHMSDDMLGRLDQVDFETAADGAVIAI